MAGFREAGGWAAQARQVQVMSDKTAAPETNRRHLREALVVIVLLAATCIFFTARYGATMWRELLWGGWLVLTLTTLVGGAEGFVQHRWGTSSPQWYLAALGSFTVFTLSAYFLTQTIAAVDRWFAILPLLLMAAGDIAVRAIMRRRGKLASG